MTRAPPTRHQGGGGWGGGGEGEGGGGDGGDGGVWHSMLAILLKLRSTTSQNLQGAPPGCDSPRMPPLASCTPSRIVLHSCARNSPIDRTTRPAVAKKTPIERRQPTFVQSAVKQVCASVMPTIMSGKKEPSIRPRRAGGRRLVGGRATWTLPTRIAFKYELESKGLAAPCGKRR